MFSWEITSGSIPHDFNPWEINSWNVWDIEVYEYVEILKQITEISDFCMSYESICYLLCFWWVLTWDWIMGY